MDAGHAPAAERLLEETPIARTAQRLIAAVEQRDAQAFAALFAESAVAHHPLSPEPARGRAAIRASEEELFNAFSDVRVELRSVLYDERTGALEVVLSATNTGPLDLGDDEPLAASGRRINLPATWWYELDDRGLVRETRDYFDTGVLMSQLGVA